MQRQVEVWQLDVKCGRGGQAAKAEEPVTGFRGGSGPGPPVSGEDSWR